MKTFWELDHDDRAKLCKEDPEGFKALYEAELDERGKKVMWRLQAEASLIKNPMVRAEKAFFKMQDSFKELNESLQPFRNKGELL